MSDSYFGLDQQYSLNILSRNNYINKSNGIYSKDVIEPELDNKSIDNSDIDNLNTIIEENELVYDNW